MEHGSDKAVSTTVAEHRPTRSRVRKVWARTECLSLAEEHVQVCKGRWDSTGGVIEMRDYATMQ
jgi:hypothetical protein